MEENGEMLAKTTTATTPQTNKNSREGKAKAHNAIDEKSLNRIDLQMSTGESTHLNDSYIKIVVLGGVRL